MECNHCGEKGHLVAKCPHKKCVYCNETGHTVSRCNAAPKAEIDRFLDDRHQTYVNREQRRDNIFQRHHQQQQQQQPPPVVAPSIVDMFADAPSLCKKPTKVLETPVVHYAKVAEISATLKSVKETHASGRLDHLPLSFLSALNKLTLTLTAPGTKTGI
jgi:hypothetical protein